VVVKVEKLETILMPEGCYWVTKNGVYSIYFSYPVVGSGHEYLGEITDLIGQTYNKDEVTTIAVEGRDKKIKELAHGHDGK